ncbi:MAG: Hsp20/alpha crystallin family protein [Anaerolineae bacterium]|nr:Hsp20/alpha crystallin family protein [Anaerolineae bacterium]
MLRRANRQFTPPTDVIELDGKVVVVVEIAGMGAGDFNIMLQNRSLTITGVRKRMDLDHPAYHQVEINYGEFRIDLTLPWSAQKEMISAYYQHGFLIIEIPRKPVEQVRIVDLNAKDGTSNE